MDNSGFSTTDAGVLAAISGVSRGGYYGGGHGSQGNFLGDGSAVASKVECTNASLAQADRDRKDANSEGRTTDLDNHIRDMQTQNLTLALNQQGQISDLAAGNMRTALENQIGTQAIVQRVTDQLAVCCCENRVANEKSNAKLDAIAAAMIADRQSAEIQTLRDQASRNDVNGETVAILNAINGLAQVVANKCGEGNGNGGGWPWPAGATVSVTVPETVA